MRLDGVRSSAYPGTANPNTFCKSGRGSLCMAHSTGGGQMSTFVQFGGSRQEDFRETDNIRDRGGVFFGGVALICGRGLRLHFFRV